jgi:hypothetical protein
MKLVDGQEIDRKRLEAKRRVNSEVTTARSAASSEKILALRLVEISNFAVSSDDFSFDQLIAGNAVSPLVETHTSAEHQAGDADTVTAAVGDGSVDRAQIAKNVAIARSTAKRSNACRRVVPRGAHAAEIDHQAGGRRVAGVRVSAGPRDQRYAELARPQDRYTHVVRTLAQRDTCRNYGSVAQVIRESACGESRVAGA